MKKVHVSNDLDEFYQNCAYPKPKPTKKKPLLYNGYKDKPKRRCWYTGLPGAERHEIWPGTYLRQVCIRHKFQIDVCPRIHAELQANGSAWAKIENQKWKMYFQWKYEQEKIEEGLSPEQARLEWMELIGRNYL